MSGLGATAISGILADNPELAARVRYTAECGEVGALVGEVKTALCTGLEQVHVYTDQGLYSGADGFVRYSLDAEPKEWARNNAIAGQVIELLLYGETVWRRVRVSGRRAMAGAVRLNVSAEFDQK